MNAVEHVLIYPFSAQFCAQLRYLVNKGFDSAIQYHPVSPSGYALWGDAGLTDGKGIIGVNVTDDVEAMLAICDTVWLVPVQGNEMALGLSFNVAQAALRLGKNVVSCIDLFPDQKDSLISLANENQAEFHNANNTYWTPEVYANLQEKLANAYIPNATVVAVGGLFPGLDQLDIVLSLHQTLQHEGYSVVSITNLKYSKLLELNNYPPVLFKTEMSIPDRIYFLNHYIQSIDALQKPDIILLELPGGILPQPKVTDNDFGVYSYMIGQAVLWDYFICAIPFGANLKGDKYVDIASACRERFGAAIDCYHMSNTCLNDDAIIQGRVLSYFHIGIQDVDNNIVQIKNRFPNLEIPIYNLNCEVDFNRAVSHMCETLSQYSETTAVTLV